jgi:hypothetical protein
MSSVLNAAEVARSYPSTLPLPSTQLGPFMNGQLGAVLAPLDHDVNAPRQEAVELREKFADEMEMVSAPEKPVYKQAMMVMEMIIGAMDEREKALNEAHRGSARGRPSRAAVKQWANRGNVLRQTIDRAYAVEREMERRGFPGGRGEGQSAKGKGQRS